MPLTIEHLPLAFKLIRFVLKIPVKSPKLKVVKVNKHDWIDTDRLMSRYNQKLENPFKISNPWKWKKISRHFWYANKNVTIEEKSCITFPSSSISSYRLLLFKKSDHFHCRHTVENARFSSKKNIILTWIKTIFEAWKYR